MNRYVFSLILFIHSGIHLMAFARAYDLAQLFPFTKMLNRPIGAAALIAGVLFFWSGVQVLSKRHRWNRWVLVAVFFSCLLLLIVWPEARGGFLANGIILLAAIVTMRRKGAIEKK